MSLRRFALMRARMKRARKARMKFGAVPDAVVRAMDTRLPPDHPSVMRVLVGPSSTRPEIFLGCPTWSEKAWRGVLYAERLQADQMLRAYAEQFNAIELNSTHYAVPNDEVIARWVDAVPSTFLFCPKFPKQISHDAGLVGASRPLDHFLTQIQKFGGNLGIPFLQMGPDFTKYRGTSLLDFLRDLPMQVAVELREESWFAAPVWAKLCDKLADLGHALVISDTAGRRDALHMALSTRTAFIRFQGYDQHPIDEARVQEWLPRLASWTEAGLEKLYIFAHSEIPPQMPELARHWAQGLNAALRADVHVPQLYAKQTQQSLF